MKALSIAITLVVWAIIFAPTYGASQPYREGSSSRVVILDIIGSDDARRDLAALQSALARAGLDAVEYRELVRLIRVLQVRPEQSTHPDTIRTLSDELNIDFFFLLDYVKSDQLELTVVEGQNGEQFWQRSFRVPKKGFNRGQWLKLAQRIRDELPDDSTALIEEGEIDDARFGNETSKSRSVVQLHVGALAINRNFAASGKSSIDNPLTGGIEYRLGFVPGFALDAEVMPFAKTKTFGFGIGYEQAFFRTKQTTIVPIAAPNGGNNTTSNVKILESGHRLMFGRIFYRHRLPSAIEVTGGLRGSFTQFVIDGESEYKGVTYTTLDFELGGHFPIYREMIALELTSTVSPLVSLGKTIEELGSSDTTIGISAGGGLAFRLDSGFSLKGLVAYTNYRSEIQGSGRDGRMIDESLDQYISMRILGGFIY